MTAFDRVVAAFEGQGLTVQRKGAAEASAQAPGHSSRDRSVSIRGIDGQVLVYSHADPLDAVLDAVGLSSSDLFDSPKGIEYRYADGRVVHRTPGKRFRQSGASKGTACLYRLDRLADAATVYITEGEKDCAALESVGVVATSTPMGAGNAHKCDLTPLRDKSVVIVADRDDKGHKHARQLVALLDGIAANVAVVEAATGKDAADHIAAGRTVADFVLADHIATDQSAGRTTEPEPAAVRRVVAVKASDVVIKRVRWLFDRWVVLGGLTLLAGREGQGKSTLAVWIAAHVSRGSLPGELYGTPRTVVYLATEDDPAFTVAPRLKAAGADMSRVLFLTVHTESSSEGVVALPGDLPALERIIADHEAALVVLDAATSAMDSRLDGHDDRAVRRFLEPLAQTAARTDCAVLGVVHFGKREGADTGKLILGSVAWSQVARSVLAVAQNPDTDELVITNTKKNLAPDTRSAAARVVSAHVDTDDGPTSVGAIHWLGDVDTDARDLLESSEDDSPAAAEAWLADYLTQQGTAPSRDAKAEARKADISERTLKRAAKKLGVIVTQVGFPRTTHWALPDDRAPNASATTDNAAFTTPTAQRLTVVDPMSHPDVRTQGRTAGQWLGSGEPVERRSGT